MSREVWDRHRIPAANSVWQLYHENSKGTRFRRPVTEATLLEWQSRLAPSLSYEGHPLVPLPEPQALTCSLDRALAERATAAAFAESNVSLEHLATILHHAYGIDGPSSTSDEFPFGSRDVPSAGALYPLELYVHAASVAGLAPGIYHFEPALGALRRFVDGDCSDRLASSLAQPDLARAAVTVFTTVLFERTTGKYGERGYRFALIEAGHVAQNMALCTAALGLAGTPIGGFFDYAIDELLQIDGVNHSTVYLFALGKPAESRG
ncbi:MAG: SagB/ThcOx family dehydrogenase [Candidatus Tumulicola sp.]